MMKPAAPKTAFALTFDPKASRPLHPMVSRRRRARKNSPFHLYNAIGNLMRRGFAIGLTPTFNKFSHGEPVFSAPTA